jgi:hypothetical protein
MSLVTSTLAFVIFTFFALTAATRAGERTITATEANGTHRDIDSKMR